MCAIQRETKNDLGEISLRGPQTTIKFWNLADHSLVTKTCMPKGKNKIKITAIKPMQISHHVPFTNPGVQQADLQGCTQFTSYCSIHHAVFSGV